MPGIIDTGLGSYVDHLLTAKRQRRERYRELESVLLQLHELDQEDFRRAGQAAKEASERGLPNSEVSHPGARVWALRDRLRAVADPVYPELSADCKEAIDQIDEWIGKLNDGGALAHFQVTWVCGGAGTALNELPALTIRERVKRWLRLETAYPDAMAIKSAQQAKVMAGLAARRDTLDETGGLDDTEHEQAAEAAWSGPRPQR